MRACETQRAAPRERVSVQSDAGHGRAGEHHPLRPPSVGRSECGAIRRGGTARRRPMRACLRLIRSGEARARARKKKERGSACAPTELSIPPRCVDACTLMERNLVAAYTLKVRSNRARLVCSRSLTQTGNGALAHSALAAEFAERATRAPHWLREMKFCPRRRTAVTHTLASTVNGLQLDGGQRYDGSRRETIRCEAAAAP